MSGHDPSCPNFSGAASEVEGAAVPSPSPAPSASPPKAAPPAPAPSSQKPARLPAASVGRRLATSGLEYMLLIGSLIFVTAFGYATAFLAKLLLPLLAIYWLVRDMHGGKYSPGKLLGRFRVVDVESGQVATVQACLLRNSYYVALIILAAVPFWDFFNMFLVTFVMVVDVLVMIATPNNQRLGDLLAKTQVVPVR